MPAAQRAFVLDPKYRWIGLVLLVVVVGVFLVIWPYLSPANTPEGLSRDACAKAVLAEPGVSTSAQVEDMQTSNLTQSPLFLGWEKATDIAVNGFVVDGDGPAAVTNRFVCKTHLDGDSVTITELTVG